MKNRLIYILISTMAIALIGSIAIQVIWIQDGIAEGKKKFAQHANDALNRVNDDIDEDEATWFIEQKFGSVDSLMERVMIVGPHSSHEEVVVINENEGDSQDIRIQYSISDSLTRVHDELMEHHDEMRRLQVRADSNSRIEIRMDHVDSIIESMTEFEQIHEAHQDNISSVIKHFTYEKLLTGDLIDRIPPNELKEKIAKATKKEGLPNSFEFGVYNTLLEEYEEEYSSNGFSQDTNGTVFRKELFQNDQLKAGEYELILQFDNTSAYVMKEVKSMAIMSGIFTLLILICFWYAIYYIFKQKKISQVKNDFINNMTHELKTPLATISLASASIKHPEVIGNADEVKHFADIIESEKQRMNAHIERVLDIAALDIGELQLNMSTVDLIDLVKKSLKNLDLSLSEANGGVEFNHSISSATINGDEFHLINSFTNILDNSIKYSQENLRIEVSLIEKNQSYQLIIEDNGIGMSSKAQKLAFDKFFRAETGNIHNRKGFGLGLSYVKSIVEKHKGQVSLTSEPGKGTSVTISLPKT